MTIENPNNKIPDSEENSDEISDEKALQKLSKIIPTIQEHRFQEQAFFWSRFSAFATLHGGLFVLATSNAIKNQQYISYLGVLLGLLWIFIQWASLYYVDRWKGQYYEYLKLMEINLKRHWLFSRPRFSSTDFAVFTTIIVFILWVLIAIGVIKIT